MLQEIPGEQWGGKPRTRLVQIGTGSQRNQKDVKKEAICFEIGQLRGRKILVM